MLSRPWRGETYAYSSSNRCPQMRVLVTGHLGYIGTVLYPRMLQEGFEVVGLDSDLYRGSTFGSAPQEVETISKDLCDVEQTD